MILPMESTLVYIMTVLIDDDDDESGLSRVP